ncbi:MAG: HAD family hydrolase [Candidatus Obscuribacterales bacterium]|jgi:HAD superfamily hydrolase (TIGR01549 family)|nr:HAD family hydrolase [Candidatus Obscuribacterales bacterium]
MINDNLAQAPLATGHRPVWILLDLYKTLLRATYPEPIMQFQQILGYKSGTGLTSPDPEFLDVCLTTASKRVRDAFHQNRELVEEDPEEYAYLVASAFGLTVPKGAVAALRELTENEQLGLSSFGDCKEQIKVLRSQGFKIALASNTWPFPIPQIFSKTEGHLVREDFDELVMSYELGIAKPHPEFYFGAGRRCGTHVGDCLMVGDNPVLDIKASLDVGMRAAHIDRYGEYKHNAVPGVPYIRKISHLYAPAAAAEV